MKNSPKFIKNIYEMYYSDTCPIDIRKKKRSESIKKDPNSNYNAENKRIYKSIFKHFEKSDFSIINFIQNDDFDMQPSDGTPVEIKKQESKSDNQPIFTFLGGSKIMIEEKASFFTKWVSSILQFLREFDIVDEVKNFILNDCNA